MTKIFDTVFGKVTLKNCMVSLDRTNITDGTSIYLEDEHIIDVTEYKDLEDMTDEDCEDFIEIYMY
jgi:hypothetical protein